VRRRVDDRIVAGRHPVPGSPGVSHRGDGQLGHGGDAGERFAAESQRADAGQVVHGAQLAGAVALHRELQLVRRDPVAVVGDLNQAQPALVHFHGHPAGARVDGVLDQLLHHRCGTLDHLAGGDLARDFG